MPLTADKLNDRINRIEGLMRNLLTRVDSALSDHTHASAGGQGGQLNATNIFNAGTVPTARLGSGSASSSTFLRGDQSWAAASGNWSEIADTTLGADASSIDFQNLANHNSYMIVLQLRSATAAQDRFDVRANNDSGASYAWRWGNLAGSYSTSTSASDTAMQLGDSGNGYPLCSILYISNLAAGEQKSFIAIGDSDGAMVIAQGKWTNTTDVISRLTFIAGANGGVANFESGSRIVIYGSNS